MYSLSSPANFPGLKSLSPLTSLDSNAGTDVHVVEAQGCATAVCGNPACLYEKDQLHQRLHESEQKLRFYKTCTDEKTAKYEELHIKLTKLTTVQTRETDSTDHQHYSDLKKLQAALDTYKSRNVELAQRLTEANHLIKHGMEQLFDQRSKFYHKAKQSETNRNGTTDRICTRRPRSALF